MSRMKTHSVMIRVRFDAPLTAKQARYAVWGHIQGLDLYGDGKPERGDQIMGWKPAMPFGAGKISVKR